MTQTAPPATEPDTVQTIDHVIIAVSDLEGSTEAYSQLIGAEPGWRGRHPGFGTANALFKFENTYLELIAPAGEGAIADQIRAHIELFGTGLIGCAFGVSDAGAFSQRLSSHGISATEPMPGEGRDEVSGAVRQWRNVYLPRDTFGDTWVFAIEHLSPPEALPFGQARPGEGLLFELDHIVLNTADPDKTARIYGDVMGMRLALDKTFPKWGSRMQFFRAGGITFEVVASLEQNGSPAPDRFYGLSFRTKDINASRDRLAASGFDVSEVRPGRKEGTKVLTVRDGTYGVPVLLIQHP